LSGGKPLPFYSTIGGGLDDGESLIDGVIREVVEETGVMPKVGKLLCIQQYADKNDNLEFFFHVTNTEDFKIIDLSKTTHGMEEIAEFGFFNPSDVRVLPDFLNDFSVEELVNSDEVKIFNYL
jgi:ADP-ribose pyrophosphatase YjhB (NUDIX family)